MMARRRSPGPTISALLEPTQPVVDLPLKVKGRSRIETEMPVNPVATAVRYGQIQLRPLCFAGDDLREGMDGGVDIGGGVVEPARDTNHAGLSLVRAVVETEVGRAARIV